MMRKYAIVKDSKVTRVIVCDDSTRIDLAPDETIHKADALKIKAGDFFYVAPREEYVEDLLPALPVGKVSLIKLSRWQKFLNLFKWKK